METPKDKIRTLLLNEGFDAVGFTVPSAVDHAGPRLEEWLAAGRHGAMDWMETRAHHRTHPQNLWPQTRSIVVVGSNYGPSKPQQDPLIKRTFTNRANISVYAQGKDYHDLMKKRLKKAARVLHAEFNTELKVFVDTAPVMEKPLAMAAGLGWQGKHTNLVSKDFGSWLFLGAMFLAIDLEPDRPTADTCGSCRSCLDICPTGAFPAPGTLDARRCISYLTIEHKGHIPIEFRVPIGNRIYGCDDCLAVCPWNKFASATGEVAFHPRAELVAPLLGDLAGLDDASFRTVFSGSPVKRIGRDRFVRNVMIAIGNTKDNALIPVVSHALSDVSPLVRAMAVWALHRLADEKTCTQARRSHLPDEADTDVRLEWGVAGGKATPA